MAELYLVTGGAGFIGSTLVRALNDRGISDVLVVDDLTHGDKCRNLADCVIADYMHVGEFRALLDTPERLPPLAAILHQGACTDTTEADGRFMMDNNFTFSKALLHVALDRRIPMTYASSASVYGDGACFDEGPDCERPLNVYAWSKLVFDQHVRRHLPPGAPPGAPLVGLRYFNVYGAREAAKGRMASMVYQLHHQLRATGVARLFDAYGGCEAGEQRRDFVHVSDVVAANLHFIGGPSVGAIVNMGSGEARTFNDVARALITHVGGDIEYFPFPDSLQGRYQCFTQASLDRLRDAGYTAPMKTLEEGVALTVNELSMDGVAA